MGSKSRSSTASTTSQRTSNISGAFEDISDSNVVTSEGSVSINVDGVNQSDLFDFGTNTIDNVISFSQDALKGQNVAHRQIIGGLKNNSIDTKTNVNQAVNDVGKYALIGSAIFIGYKVLK